MSRNPACLAGDVSQMLPDSTKCWGLTEACRTAWMAYEHNVQWVPHGWNTAIGLAADLHLSAAMPVSRQVEYLTPSPYLFEPGREGPLMIPDKSGLGIELNRESRGAEPVGVLELPTRARRR